MSAAIVLTDLPSPPLVTSPFGAGPSSADQIVTVAQALLPTLARGAAIDARTLRAAMEAAFGGSDAEGLWSWKGAYEACEVAQVLFLRRFGRTMQAQARDPAAFGAMLAKVAALLPTQTRRSEESQALQQFSTPVGLAHVAAAAGAITSADFVLEPSAGTGLLAIFAELAGARLALNELTDTRADLLGFLFPGGAITRHDAAQIHDHLDAAVRPSVILMNPPFSALAGVDGAFRGAASRHLASALARLAPGGRLVAITGAGFSPESPSGREAFQRIQGSGRIVLTVPVSGRVFARHGTTIETRVTVIDRVPADDPRALLDPVRMAETTAELLALVERLPPRPSCLPSPPLPVTGSADRTRDPASPRGGLPTRTRPASPRSADGFVDAVELAYDLSEPVENGGASRSDGRQLSDALYVCFSME